MHRKTELWVAGGLVLVVIIIAVLAGIFGSAAPSTSSFKATTTAPLSEADHIRGDATSSVSVIEYGDFECPACGAYEPYMQQLTQQYGDRVAFAFRNFPLPQHQDAQIAAQAAEAAALQGKYWQMHDLLYQKQQEWSAEGPDTVVAKYFDGYAQQIGLDVAAFNKDIESSAVKNKVQSDMASGNTAQVDHTPTFFINLTQIENPGSVEDFKKAIDAALASSGSVASSSAR